MISNGGQIKAVHEFSTLRWALLKNASFYFFIALFLFLFFTKKPN